MQIFGACFQIVCINLSLPTFQSIDAFGVLRFATTHQLSKLQAKTCVKDICNKNPKKTNLCRKQIQLNRLQFRGSKNTDSKDYCHTPQASCATFTKWPKWISDHEPRHGNTVEICSRAALFSSYVAKESVRYLSDF